MPSVRIEPIEDRTGGPDVEEYAPAHVTFYEDGLAHQFGKAGRDIRFGPFGRYMEMMEDFAQIVRKEHANPYTYEYELMVQRTLLKACDHWKEDAV